MVRHAIRGVLVMVALAGAAPTAWGMSAANVFDSVSPSVVVVFAVDGAGKDRSQGSGVVIEQGVVVTNCHVLEEGVTSAVVYQGRRYPARLHHADWDRDVCSLTVEDLTAPPVPLGATRHLKVGQKVYAVGAPAGLDLTLSEGIISSLRDWGGDERFLQITAPISPGSSGGGLFDEDGRLIGLTTFYLTEGQQLNFAVPVEFVRQLPERHAAHAGGASTDRSSIDWLARAVALEGKKDWSALQHHAQAWTRAQPNNATAWFFLGAAYNSQGQTAKAIEAYQQALHLNPQDAMAWSILGLVYCKQGQWAKAIEASQQALRLNPQNAMAWYALGLIYDGQGQWAKAIEASQQALRLDPQDAMAWYALGWAYGGQGQWAKAIEAYQQALRLNPQNAKVWYNLGWAYSQQGQWAKAIEASQQALRLNPQDANAWVNLGLAHAGQGQWAKAIEALQQALRLDPQDANAWYALGLSYWRQKDRAKVIEAYQQLKRLDPELADQLFRLAVLP